ncbi:MAG: hypothetical protein KF753_01885 [Caldilineaceae bacterium]|nr:hypothetical protein [Caldilineaceae bacterium]
MSVYRQERQGRPLRLGVIGLLVLAVAIASILFLRSRTTQAPADPMAAARAKAQETAQGLDIFAVEYPQAAQGVERAGALDGLARARSAWEAAQSDLTAVDGAATAAISADLNTLSEKAQADAPAEEVIPLVEQTQQAIFALIRASQSDQ